MIDVAIIGAGLMGRWHLAAAQAAGARVAAIVDHDVGAAHGLARKAPGATVAQDIAELPAGSARVAHVCLPTHWHASTASTALVKGMATLVEKPIAESAVETERLMEASERSGLLICPVHQYAFQTGIEATLKNLPRLGALRRIEFDIRSAGAAGGRISPNELIADILPHPLSVLQRLQPSIVLSELRWSVRSAPGEFLAVAQHNQLQLVMCVSASARPTCFKTLVVGDRASAEVDGFHGYAVLSVGEATRASKLAAPFEQTLKHFGSAATNLAQRAMRREFAYPGLVALTRRFYAAVLKGDRALSPISARAAIDNAQARDQLIDLLRDTVPA